ncbi:hypothetical protein [Streptomyces sp. NPDC058268]|uniref:hypothetical protein n=1 Tax=Streptomyces sp. NPDC058268 TaxID=3346413 RepID=UPI0036EFE1B8
MRSKLGLLLALGLLAVAFPSATLLVFEILSMIVAAVLVTATWVTAHLALVCTAVALAVLAYAFPDAFRRTARWIVRAVADSVRTVMPQESGSAPRPAAR